jgi:hypothetical protein
MTHDNGNTGVTRLPRRHIGEHATDQRLSASLAERNARIAAEVRRLLTLDDEAFSAAVRNATACGNQLTIAAAADVVVGRLR